MALRQITEARHLSAFMPLLCANLGLLTQTSRHLQKACNLPAARQRSERKDGEGEAQMLKVGACLLNSEMGSD